MSIQLTADQEFELTELARVSHRTLDDLAQEAVARFLADEAAHRAKIARARERIARGQTIAHEELFAKLKQRMGWEMRIRWTEEALSDLEAIAR